ncbi:MAG: hypothetical protein CMJ35_00820 [Phycisphaerae bacterium]|mgnify:FL=1|nr:hypothetical protein [Phycisphaerae bacterium]MBM90143.1 hypothetical protein [Phycisphaerae bacterium]|tara:strand:- start:639 stop:1070 length:432 start_codon:yes stop_codon:yes gene_type:complete
MLHRRVRIWTARLAISLALLLIVLVVGSGWYSGAYAMQAGSRVVMLGFGSGQGAFVIGEQGAQSALGWSLHRFDPSWRWWFSIAQTPQSSQMLIPLWAPALVLLVFGWWARPKRLGKGQCLKCGYALGGADGELCPECGMSRG